MFNTMKITVEIKNNYGNQAIYPTCDTGKLFARLTGTKTLTLSALATIKALGYKIEQVLPKQTLDF